MLDRPVAFRVQIGIEIRVGIVQDLIRLELVEPQQPVRLIEPVLPQKRRLSVQRGEPGVLGDRDIGRIEHPLQAVFLVHALGQLEDVVVRLRRRTHDHLGALSCGREAGRFAVKRQLFPVGRTLGRDLLHGAEDGMPPLVRGQKLQAALAGQLHVDAQAVRQKAQLFQQFRAGPRDGLGVDVAAEMVLVPEQPQDGQHPLGGVIGADQHRAGQEQSLDVVAAVELDGQFRQFAGRKGRAGDIVGLPVDAVAAIERAAVGHQDLQQAHTAAVCGKGMAASGRIAASDAARLGCPGRAAGRTGHVIFCAVGQNGQLLHQRLFHLRPSVPSKKAAAACSSLFSIRSTTWPSSRPHGPRCADGSGPHP